MHYVAGCLALCIQIETERTVNASCTDGMVVKAVQKERPQCWQDCPQPTNQSSACFLDCLFVVRVGIMRQSCCGPSHASVREIARTCFAYLLLTTLRNSASPGAKTPPPILPSSPTLLSHASPQHSPIRCTYTLAHTMHVHTRITSKANANWRVL